MTIVRLLVATLGCQEHQNGCDLTVESFNQAMARAGVAAERFEETLGALRGQSQARLKMLKDSGK